MVRVEVLKRAKRSRRGKMLGDQRDPETHLLWFVSLCDFQTVLLHIILHGCLFVLYVKQVGLSAEKIRFSLLTQYHACLFSTLTCYFLSLCCASWTLCQRRSSRRFKGPFISSPWAIVCPRPCNRPKTAPTASGTHSLFQN